MVSLSVSTLTVDGIGRGDHVCAVLNGQAAQEELVSEFVVAGLRRHERVAYFAGDSSPERVLGMLQGGGVSTAEAIAQGQLLVVPTEGGDASEPPLDPSQRIADLSAAIDAALAEGYSGFRATGEQWTAPEPPPEELLLDYESRVSELCATRSMVGLCQYHGNRCDQRLLDMVSELHPHVVRNALVSGDELLRIVPLCQDEQGNSWLRIVGEADLSNSALLLAALEEEGHGDVHLDLERLRFVDLKGVEALLELTDGLRPSERRLVVHNAPPTLRRIVEVVGDSLPSMEISAL